MPSLIIPNIFSSKFLEFILEESKITKSKSLRLELLCISLANNSLPLPLGPSIKILPSEFAILFISSLIFKISFDWPINSKDLKIFSCKFCLEVDSSENSIPLLIKFNNLS